MAAEALVSVSKGVMNSVLEKLATLRVHQAHEMQREVAFLKDELSSMDAVIKKLENMEEELDPQTREWKNQVIDMAFHIEDCINDFMHESGYLPSHCVDPYVVATHSDGGQGAFGYWIYPLGDGSTGYLQPVWMAVM
ncbi:disease resistance protein Pik-2 [Triticum aestivum]|uniref:disease resistance protein Pik-2 n=1 Tax=Triticum aestivum TaxID=4565 RepID=UPI000843602A|nr:disease resistance protein Pik-2-like [Triticum aestivum]